MIEILSSCSWTKALTWLLHGSSKLRALVPNVRRRLIAAHTIHFFVAHYSLWVKQNLHYLTTNLPGSCLVMNMHKFHDLIMTLLASSL